MATALAGRRNHWLTVKFVKVLPGDWGRADCLRRWTGMLIRWASQSLFMNNLILV